MSVFVATDTPASDFWCSGDVSSGFQRAILLALGGGVCYICSIRFTSDVTPLLVYMSQFCLCWRCTRAGTSGDPDVVLLHWALWVQGDLILIYYWGRLRSVAPTGGNPCSAVLRHLQAVNALVPE